MRIAIVKLSALGDIIHAMVGLQFIKKTNPDIEIDWIVEAKFSEILRHNPDLSQVLTVNLQSIKQSKLKIFNEYRRIKRYAENYYDLVIDAQSLIKSSLVAKLLGGKVFGFDGVSSRESFAAFFYDQTVACSYAKNTIDRNAFILTKQFDLEVSPEQILAKKPFLFYKNENTKIFDYFHSTKKNVIFVIGSSWESKNYPKQKFLQIAQNLHVNCLAIWGNEQEQKNALWLESQAKNISAMPKMDLNSLKAAIAKSDLVIGNDTGPTHMAWALNKPSVTIFGPTPVSRVYQTEINRVIKSPSKINPYKLNKNDFSIKDIDEHKVIEIAEDLLKFPQ